MFKWIKNHGCNCCPLTKGFSKYTINIGDIFGGVVENEDSPTNWSAKVTVLGKMITGRSGGGMTRDEGMRFVEEHVLEAISDILTASKNKADQREIYDSLFERNDSGDLEQKLLEE
jgi:hypothetical protein